MANPNTEPLTDDEGFASRTLLFTYLKSTENTYVFRQVFDGTTPKVMDRMYLQKWMFGETYPEFIEMTITPKKKAKGK
jgi:hypothetical protein